MSDKQEQKLDIELTDVEKLKKNYDIVGDGVAVINATGLREIARKWSKEKDLLTSGVETKSLPVELLERIKVHLVAYKYQIECRLYELGGSIETDSEYQDLESILKEIG